MTILDEHASTQPRWRRDPRFLLVRFFFLQMFENEVSGRHGEARISVPAALALLATPGLLLPLFLLDKYSTLMNLLFRGFSSFNRDLFSIPDKYLFITYAMLVSGIVTVLRWNSLLPDRTDATNFGSLPLTPSKMFAAKFVALTGFMAVLTVVANVGGAVLFPAIVSDDGPAGSLLVFMLGHLVAVSAASVFSFLTITALLGLLLNVLPAKLMRRASTIVQAVVVAVLLAALLLSPAIYTLAGRRAATTSYLVYFPPTWFLGLYQLVQGKADAAYASLGHFAVVATLFSFVAVIASYILWLPGFLTRTTEEASVARTGSRLAAAIQSALAGLLLRAGFQRSVMPFLLGSLWRDQTHRVVVAASASIGIGVAFQTLTYFLVAQAERPGQTSPEQLLTLPLMPVAAMLIGLRKSFDIPAVLRANWIFRSVPAIRVVDSRAAARKLLLLCGVAPFIALSAVAGLLVAPAWWVLMHLVFTIGIAMLLIEFLLHNYNELPFTSSRGGASNLAGRAALWVAGWLVITNICAAFERVLVAFPPVWLAVGVLAIGASLYLASRRSHADTENAEYDTSGESATLTLDITLPLSSADHN